MVTQATATREPAENELVVLIRECVEGNCEAVDIDPGKRDVLCGERPKATMASWSQRKTRKILATLRNALAWKYFLERQVLWFAVS